MTDSKVAVQVDQDVDMVGGDSHSEYRVNTSVVAALSGSERRSSDALHDRGRPSLTVGIVEFHDD